MRLVSVVGTRPQFVKLGAFLRPLTSLEIDHKIINTGQHYDPEMSKVFFDDLKIPQADFNLGIGSNSHGIQTGRMMEALDEILPNLNPHWVVVYGDTNSTLAATLSAVKLGIPVAHLEAGLRSFNRRMPEEINRILTDHASDVLLAPTKVAMSHLERESLGSRSHLVGDLMTDICFHFRDKVSDFTTQSDFLLCTLHRAENTDNSNILKKLIHAIKALPIPVKLVAHPRLISRVNEFGIDLAGGAIEVLKPVPYPEMIKLILQSRSVLTDSGGLQKECYLLNRICTTLRTETEWVETLVDGWNVLDPLADNLSENVFRDTPVQNRNNYYGDGDAAIKSVKLLNRLAQNR